MDEAEILDNAFNLLFAFDEVVALGYRESVNLAQIRCGPTERIALRSEALIPSPPLPLSCRTFVEMDSHEEKVYQAVRATQEREAKQTMRERAKELQRQRMEQQKRGGRPGGMGGMGSGGGGGGYGGQGGFMPSSGSGSESLSTPAEPPKPTYSAAPGQRKAGSSKAMKLGGRSKVIVSRLIGSGKIYAAICYMLVY